MSCLVSIPWITACAVMTNTNLFAPSPSYQKRGTSYLVSTALDYRLRGNDEYKPIRTLAVIPEARNELSGIHPMDYRLRGNGEYKLIHTLAVIPEARNELSGIHPMDYRLRGNDVGKITDPTNLWLSRSWLRT